MNPLPLDDPVVVRLVQGLVRIGMVVLVHDSEDLRAGRILPHEVDDLVAAFIHLESQPFVKPGRVGFGGFSVGASLALLAAADPRLADRVAFVNAFGGYASAREMLVAIATRSAELQGQRVPWEPSEFAVQVFRKQLIDTAPTEEERARLWDLVESRAPSPAQVPALSPEGMAILAALTERDPAQVPGRLAALSPQAQALLDALSPSLQLHGLRARLFLMHDRADSYVPYTESRRLAAGAAGARLVRHTEFALFQHVTPSGELALRALVPQVWRLLGHLQAVLLEVL
ncbi:MAG: hypothetical protein HY330_06935 [Chloroflexi bacterium]|nr:hypothetical protein [Chloroflexota bacterium]